MNLVLAAGVLAAMWFSVFAIALGDSLLSGEGNRQAEGRFL